MFNETKFRERIKALLRANHMTYEDGAEVAEISPETLASYIRGKTQAKLFAVAHLAEHFGVSIDYLAGLTDERKPL